MFDIGYEVYDMNNDVYGDVVDVDENYVKIDVAGDEYWVHEHDLMFADTAYYMNYGECIEFDPYHMDGDNYGYFAALIEAGEYPDDWNCYDELGY